MPKNLGLYNENLSVPRKQDIDAVASRVNTNEDNIAMLDSDMEAAQGDITTLKGNVTTLTTALQSKQDKIVGGASTITDDNLAANRALVSNGSGKVAVSAVTATELGYLDGVTSNVQTQLNKKLESAPVTSVNAKTGAVVLSASDVGALPTANVTQTLGTSTTKVPSEKAVADALSGAGAGDMLKATYDPTGSVEQAGGIPDYVEANGGKIDTIKVNGTAQPIVNKEVDISVPTNNTQLTNGAGYITAADVPVKSVNSKTGDVVLSATDVGALPISGGTLTGNLKVGSANIQTNGYVVGTWLQATSQNHLTNAATKIAVQDGSGWIYHRTAKEIKSDIGLSNVDNVKQYSADNPPPYPVTSVAGKTGDVTLTKSNVGLGNVDNVKQYSSSNPPPYPVTSVNGKTGAVDLSASDVGAVPTSRTVNGHSLSNNVTVTKSDVGLGSVANERQYSANNPPPYPVTSVNGQTGAVEIDVGGGGTTIVLSSTQPSGLKAGDYWYQIV